MKIKSCEIGSFGRLEKRNIVLSDGITVIRGRNESGKSTISAFIKYILYGYVGRGRDEKGNEKLKYSPWNGSQSSGALVLEASDGSIFRAERKGDGKSGSSVILDSMGSKCFEGIEIGEALYGTDAVTFSKSAFVGQSDIEGSGMRDIGASLEKLLLDSDSGEDFDTAIKSLTAERNTLYNRMRSTGLIFDLCARLDELKSKRSGEAEANTRLVCIKHLAAETERKIEDNKRRLEHLYDEAENIAAYEAHERLELIRSARDAADKSCSDYERALTESERNGMLPDKQYVEDLELAYNDYVELEPQSVKADSEFGAALAERRKSLDVAVRGNRIDGLLEGGAALVHELFESADELRKSARRQKIAAIILLCLIITLPVSVVFFILSSKTKGKLSRLLSQNGFSSFEELSKFNSETDKIFEDIKASDKRCADRKKESERKKYELCEAKNRLLELLSLIGEEPSEEIYIPELVRKSVLPSLKSALARIDNAYAKYSSDKTALETLLSVSSIEELERSEAKMREEPPVRKREETDVEIRYNEGANALLSKKLTELRSEAAALEAVNADPAETDAEILRLEKQLSEARLRQEALELAIELCDESRAALRSGILPRVSESAAELFSAFTGGKYRSLFFDKDFGLRFLETGDTETRNVASLSAGAADAAYLALRIALAKVLFKEKPTFIFDESFAKCDDARLANILDALLVLSKDYQIVIFTCHEREERYLGNRCKTVILD